MNKFKFLFLLIIMLFVIITCGEPPQGTNEISLISFIKTNLDTLNQIKNDEEKFTNFFKEMSNNLQVILSFPKDTEINITSAKAAPSPDDIIYTLENNKFIIVKPVYFTFNKKESLFSFDNKTWYSTASDANKKIEGIKNNFYFDTKTQDKSIFISYKTAMSLGRNPIISDFKEQREIVKLKKGLIFSSSDEKKINADLNKVILYVPENTILHGYLNVKGNIINSEIKDGIIMLKAMQDLYFFIKKRMLSFSFDKINWNLNVLSFSINPVFDVYAKEDNEIYFNINATANYNEKQTSFSLVKLLLNAM